MRILDIRPDHEQEDTDSGRRTLAAVVANPSCTTCIIRGADPEVSGFSDRAAARADPFPWREAVWVRDRRIFADGQEQTWFSDHDNACATILDLDDLPAQWLAKDASTVNIERAWLKVEQR
jgi:hypothetical protein